MSLPDARFCVHHVGGRAGTREFPVLEKFEKDMVNVLYDADVECLDQVRQRNQILGSELHVLPYCLSDRVGQAILHVAYDPYTSSLLEPDLASVGDYLFNADHDYQAAETLKTVERRPVETITMDQMLREKSPQVPAPDFLSIDVEGAESQVLAGARETIRDHVIALVVESKLKRFYRGQKLFCESLEVLAALGFDLAQILHLQKTGRPRAPVGLRGEGFVTGVEVLFLRRIQDLDAVRDDRRRFLLLRKLAFVSIVYSHFEYALECLRLSHPLRETAAEERRSISYLQFLDAFEAEAARVPQRFPPTFAQKYTLEQSRRRFSAITSADVSLAPAGTARRSAIRIFLSRTYWALRDAWSREPAYSRIEQLLVDHGLAEQANVMRRSRRIQEPFVQPG